MCAYLEYEILSEHFIQTFMCVYAADESDSDTDMPRGRVLAAALQLVPGYFTCDCMWQTHFVLHPRLKRTGTSAPGQHFALSTCCY